MASNTATSKTAAPGNRSHSRKPAASGGNQPNANAQQERRFLLWIYSNAQRIQAAIVSSANRLGENRRFVDMESELALASEFGRFCHIGQNVPQQQQGAAVSETPRVMTAAAGA